MSTDLTVPRDLGARGRALWTSLTAVDDAATMLVLSPAERVTLELAARQADDLALLEKQLADDGLVTTGSRGQPRLSGLATEIRLQRAALARLVAGVALPEVGSDEGMTPAQLKAQKAAQARWRRRAATAARRAGAAS